MPVRKRSENRIEAVLHDEQFKEGRIRLAEDLLQRCGFPPETVALLDDAAEEQVTVKALPVLCSWLKHR